MSSPRRLADCLNIDDLQALARRRLPRPIFDYLVGGAETEVTARRNLSAFDDYGIVPRYVVDVGSVTTATRVLGQDVAWPVMCSPAGAARFYHPDGEIAVARAAAATGTLYGLAVMSTRSLEAVAAAAPGPRAFQLLCFRDRDLTAELIGRAKAAGYRALCLTVDAGVRGNRERERRTGLGVPLKLSFAGFVGFALRPSWYWRLRRSGPLSLANLEQRVGSTDLGVQTRFAGAQLEPSISWEEVKRLVEAWNGPFAIKGIMAADDARRAVDIGATAVIVSNHGGRQLDGAVAPMDVLPDIARAVGSRAEIILDGGVRRGVHVLKALALGATACSVGRPYYYGLAAGGEAGVTQALQILKTELVRAMQLSGCADVKAVDPALVRRL